MLANSKHDCYINFFIIFDGDVFAFKTVACDLVFDKKLSTIQYEIKYCKTATLGQK